MEFNVKCMADEAYDKEQNTKDKIYRISGEL